MSSGKLNITTTGLCYVQRKAQLEGNLGRGLIRIPNPEGNTLYGIEIMVDPQFRGMRLARCLCREDIARDKAPALHLSGTKSNHQSASPIGFSNRNVPKKNLFKNS